MSQAREDETHLRASIRLAWQARENGNHPFGALLVDREGNVVLEAENTVVTERDCTGHAESNLMRTAGKRFDEEFLRRCTLYTSTEPCAMCAGAIFWGGVRCVVFALSSETLRTMLAGNPDLPILELSSREVFECGHPETELRGPALEAEARVVHEGFWG